MSNEALASLIPLLRVLNSLRVIEAFEVHLFSSRERAGNIALSAFGRTCAQWPPSVPVPPAALPRSLASGR
ncbi:MAG: hypothetical protein RJA19_1741 [Bacteroidota bacterium]